MTNVKGLHQSEGVVFIGVAQERANAFKAPKKEQKGYVGFGLIKIPGEG